METTLFISLDFVNLWLLGNVLQSFWGSLGEVHTVSGVGTQESQLEEIYLDLFGQDMWLSGHLLFRTCLLTLEGWIILYF